MTISTPAGFLPKQTPMLTASVLDLVIIDFNSLILSAFMAMSIVSKVRMARQCPRLAVMPCRQMILRAYGRSLATARRPANDRISTGPDGTKAASGEVAHLAAPGAS